MIPNWFLSNALYSLNALSLVIVGLATWRITHMLMYETGPWKLLTHFRELTGIRHDTDGEPLGYPIGSVLGCHWCLSFWVSLLCLLLPTILLLPFCVSCVSILIELMTDWLRANK